jgi:hypothetical protein
MHRPAIVGQNQVETANQGKKTSKAEKSFRQDDPPP